MINREITEIENFYKTATIEEAIAYFKQVSAKCFDTIKEVIAEIRSAPRNKRRSCLVFMTGLMFTKRSLVFTYLRGRFIFQQWKKHSWIEAGIVIPVSYIDDQIIMEGLLAQAKEILSSKS
ncbi:MAG TPA: hypothetical protein VGC08_01115 [Pedobacter sp.]